MWRLNLSGMGIKTSKNILQNMIHKVFKHSDSILFNNIDARTNLPERCNTYKPGLTWKEKDISGDRSEWKVPEDIGRVKVGGGKRIPIKVKS